VSNHAIPQVETDSEATPSKQSTIYDGRFQWEIAIPIVVLHVALIAAPFTFTRGALLVAIALWCLTGCFGVTIGLHRMLTHRGFRTSKFVQYTLTLLGCLANEGPPLVWVGTHRIHHKFADLPGDPHSPIENFSWGHVVWAFFFEHADARAAAKDLMRDPGMVFIDRFYWAPQLILAVPLYLLGGWPWVVWGIVVRTLFTLHCTWFVNSVAHRWGYRNFDTPDHSKNSWWVALLTFGEGWHNNHHACQRSAAHGMYWWEVDLTYSTIRVFEYLGIVWDVKHPVVADGHVALRDGGSDEQE
jgi:stearoyl-CoA desaturase (delta-9 desaturase)